MSTEMMRYLQTGIENKIDDLKNEMEMMSGGNNNFKESEGS